MKFLKHLFIAILFCNALVCHAQTTIDKPIAKNNSVIIHADPRLSLIAAKKQGNPVGYISSGKGFRVQIYNGNDRKAAINTKIDFMRRYPNVTTYLTYVAPQFRVKVGDFKTRADAQKFNHELISFYNPTMIVPDLIVINSIQND
jgi:SPOR domain